MRKFILFSIFWLASVVVQAGIEVSSAFKNGDVLIRCAIVKDVRDKKTQQVLLSKDNEVLAVFEAVDKVRIQVNDQVSTVPFQNWQRYKAKNQIEKIEIQMPGGDIRIELKSNQTGILNLVNKARKMDIRAQINCADKTK